MLEDNRGPTANITVLPASLKDSRDIWTWRNDEITRKMSNTINPISWRAHSDWFEESLSNPYRYLYIALLNGKEKIGVCRFDVDILKEKAEVSININPLYRNRGFSSIVLKKSINIFQNCLKIKLTATIKKINTGSIKSFTSIGFNFERDDLNCNYYIYELQMENELML